LAAAVAWLYFYGGNMNAKTTALTGKRRGRPAGSKNRPKDKPEAANDVAPVNPPPKVPTFAERLEEFAASKPAPADLSATAKWYVENLDACVSAKETHPNVTYKEMYGVAQQSGLPPEVTSAQFQSKVTGAVSKKRKHRELTERMVQWRAQREAEDVVRVGPELKAEIAAARANPWPPIEVAPNSEVERGFRKLDPTLDAEIAKARGEKPLHER
jgi:hypothetical protein